MQKKVFISSSSKDAKIASSICHALEAHGHSCWISSRDVTPGENYQGAIVRAITSAGAMVMVFSSNANNSEEIKKELALASQSNRIVIPVRAEDVLPSEDFRYELATRQWIDLFDDWEKAMESLGRKIDAIIPPLAEPWNVCEAGEAPTPSPFTAKPEAQAAGRGVSKAAIGAMTFVALAAIAGGVWVMRPPPPPPHPAVPAGMMLMPQADMHPAPPPPGMDPAKIETDLWDSVKDSGDAAALNSYLAKYPGGIFAAAAKARVDVLNKPAPVKIATAKPAAPLPAAPAAAAVHEMPMGPTQPGDAALNNNVQMAVSMARSAETRAREMAENAEQMAKLAQANTPGYGTQAVHGTAQWSGRLAAFENGAPGVVTYANGDRYSGGTRSGMRNGVGIFAGAPARVYRERVGEFVTDELSGYGVVYRRDGRVRIGQWKGGQAEGYGAVFDAQGKLVEQGLFAADKLVTPLGRN